MAVMVKRHKLTYFPDEVVLNRKLVLFEGDTNVVIAFDLYDDLGNNLLEHCPYGTSMEAIFCPPEGDKVTCPLQITDGRIYLEYSVGTMERETDGYGTLHFARVNSTADFLISKEILPGLEMVIKKNPSFDNLSGNLIVASDGAYLITSDHDYILI